MMPEMDGNTLCSKIKTNGAVSHIPVILLTAKSRDEDQLEGLATGADAYIVKPFNLDILRRTIVNLIHTHQMLQLKYARNDQLEELVEDIKMKSPDEKLLEKVMSVINKNLGNSDLSVDKIADEVGISRVHLHRKKSSYPTLFRRYERIGGHVCLRFLQRSILLDRLQEAIWCITP